VAVMTAYRAAWTAFEHAAATSNAFDPRLPATMTDPLLEEVRRALVSDKSTGIVTRGAIELHPELAALSDREATVFDCTFSYSELIYSRTAKPVPPVTPPEHDGVKATLTLVASKRSATWKVSQQTITEGRCPPGY